MNNVYSFPANMVSCIVTDWFLMERPAVSIKIDVKLHVKKNKYHVAFTGKL